jgi:hypothetical protein
MNSATVNTYRGCQAGWQQVGQPRSITEAQRLLDLLQRVWPDWSSRIQPRVWQCVTITSSETLLGAVGIMIREFKRNTAS